MELKIIWCLFLSKHKIWPTCTGTCVRTYFRHFLVSFQKFRNHVLLYQEPEPALDKKFRGPEPELPQNRPAPKPCSLNSFNFDRSRIHIRWKSGLFRLLVSPRHFFCVCTFLKLGRIGIRIILIRIHNMLTPVWSRGFLAGAGADLKFEPEPIFWVGSGSFFWLLKNKMF